MKDGALSLIQRPFFHGVFVSSHMLLSCFYFDVSLSNKEMGVLHVKYKHTKRAAQHADKADSFPHFSQYTAHCSQAVHLGDTRACD